jgi:hypothetical protein
VQGPKQDIIFDVLAAVAHLTHALA